MTELHKLFTWVHRSRRGVLLFIDEADAFLASRKRGNMSETLRNALTTILYHTGTPTSQFMMVIATNRPGDLDSAVLDRLDESIEFGLPDVDARKAMVQLYFDMYITKPLKIDWRKPPEPAKSVDGGKKGLLNGVKKGKLDKQPLANLPAPPAGTVKASGVHGENGDPPSEELVDEQSLAEVAKKLHGFSGREISKLFTSLQTHVLYGLQRHEVGTKHMHKSLLFEVVDAKVLEHTRTAEFQVHGYNYEVVASLPPSVPATPGQMQIRKPPPELLPSVVGPPHMAPNSAA